MPRFEKGSQEAKDYMASIRAKKVGTPNPNKKPTKTQVKMNMGVDIPIVGSNTLIFPEYLAQPTKNGYKLVNPLTQQRHLATRAGKTAVKLVRKHIPDLVLLEGQNEPIPLKLFSKKDRTLIDAHFENIEKHKNQSPELIPEIQKSIVKSRGRPEKLPKNIEFNKEKKKENIKMVITAKKQAGRKPKYATDEERKVAKRKQTLASNKKKRAEAKGKGMKGGSLTDSIDLIFNYITTIALTTDEGLYDDAIAYVNNLDNDERLSFLMHHMGDADAINRIGDAMASGQGFNNNMVNTLTLLADEFVQIVYEGHTDEDSRSINSVEENPDVPPAEGTGLTQSSMRYEDIPDLVEGTRLDGLITNADSRLLASLREDIVSRRIVANQIYHNTSNNTFFRFTPQQIARINQRYGFVGDRKTLRNPDLNQDRHSPRGVGILQDISSALKNTFTSAVKKTKDYANVIISGRNDYPPKVRKILSELGTKMIKSAMVRRTPVPSVLTTALNAVSLGEFAKRFKTAPYDTLFHLSLVLDLEGGTKLLIEKNEVINMDKNPSIPQKTDIQLVSNIPANLSVNDMLQKAQQKMGGYYFSYSARDNNCQDYIMAILQANNMGNDENYTFIKQDTKQLFEGLTTLRKVSNTITDLGAKVNEITTGAGAGSSKIVPAKNTSKITPVLSSSSSEEDEPQYKPRISEGMKQRKEGRLMATEDKPSPKELLKSILQQNLKPKKELMKIGDGITNTIDFEDMKWGSLTKQVEVYNKQHNSNLDLHSFSMMVLANPDKFKERTKKRARFYINVINKKAMKNNISNNNITIMPKKMMKGGMMNAGQTIDPAVVRRIFNAYGWFRTLPAGLKTTIIMEAVGVINDEFEGVLSDASVMDMGGIEGFVETFRDRYTNVPIIRPMTKVSLMRKFEGRGVASDIVDTGKDIFNRARETLGVGLYASGNMSGGAIVTQSGVMYPTHTIIHYYGDPMRSVKGGMTGGDIFSDMADAFNPDKNGVAQAFQEKIVKPFEQTIVKPAEQTFTPELGRQITTGLIRQALPAVIKGVVSSGTTAVTGNPVLGFVAGQTAGKVAGDKAGEELAKATGYGVARKGRFVKGSKEAKDYMASLRAKKNA
jgi:hypothetical protein